MPEMLLVGLATISSLTIRALFKRIRSKRPALMIEKAEIEEVWFGSDGQVHMQIRATSLRPADEEPERVVLGV